MLRFLRKAVPILAALALTAGQPVCVCAAAPASAQGAATHESHGHHGAPAPAHAHHAAGHAASDPASEHANGAHGAPDRGDADCGHCAGLAVAQAPAADGPALAPSAPSERFALAASADAAWPAPSGAKAVRSRIAWERPPPQSPVLLKVRLRT